MPHERPTRSPYLPIPIVHATTSCAQRFTTARCYSSQAGETLESTPFIGDDDAAYLQRMAALGSSTSQASDLEPLEAQLAIHSVPVTVKTIGAKVIVAALEQRRQLGILTRAVGYPRVSPACGRSEIRCRRATICGALTRSIRVCLEARWCCAGRISHARPRGQIQRTPNPGCGPCCARGLQITWPRKPNAHQRAPRHRHNGSSVAAAVDKTSGENEAGAPGPIGTAMRRLYMATFMGQIIHARKTQSVYAVLPVVLAALPRIYDLDPQAYQRILGAVCGRDVYSISEVQGLARALGTVPNAYVWSQAATNAIYQSGPTDAASIVQYVYDQVLDGYIKYHAVHLTISTLVGLDYMAIPSREAVQLVWKLFELHRIKGGDRALDRGRAAPGTMMPLVSAFMADINIPERKEAVEILRSYTDDKKLSQVGKFGETWAGAAARLAGLRCTSHMNALDAAFAEPGGLLLEGDTKAIFGNTIRFRYPDATTAPVEALLKVLAFAQDKGFAPDQYYVWTYILSIYTSLFRLYADKGAGLRPVVGGASVETVLEQHTSQALASLRRVEILCHDPDFGIHLDERISAALFFCIFSSQRRSRRLRTSAVESTLQCHDKGSIHTPNSCY